ncbi:thioredoxin family protein [Rhodobium gokarnense]|uniref:Peroxiredoxin n=1 Tax=Rhodobium gokarnense TaxID=364296 RepID=A0ABT3HAX0_9HYPH|nr:thioredoxin family protein [Rhodobium gokarnense]MCW2307441.1 peroxiredoxin [Rhodobium gokarnense]
MAATPPPPELGIPAPDFTLPGIDGKTHSLSELKGEKGTVVVFICNHCPYVKAITERLVKAADDMAAFGVSLIAINSNDTATYPEDSFDRMKDFAAASGFSFPYLHDESQEVARAYDAVCTPDFFGYDAGLTLRYRGRLDEGRKDPPPAGADRELVDAMKMVAETGTGPEIQIPSMGCSIKWKETA